MNDPFSNPFLNVNAEKAIVDFIRKEVKVSIDTIFTDKVQVADKTNIRVQCLEYALRSHMAGSNHNSKVLDTAHEFEQYVLKGKQEKDNAPT